MARFNAVAERSTKTTNMAGGEAYTESAKLEIVSLILTSLVQDQFYRKADNGIARVAELLKQVEPEFAAKAAVFARQEYGMRSVSHVVAGELGRYASGAKWKRAFYTAVVRRPDDITEILAYWKSRGGKKIPSAMKYGLASAFDRFDDYQIAKYKGEGRGIKLVDAVNLLHPRPTDKNRTALSLLVKGELKATETWEAKLSAAGKNDEEKEGAWRSLLIERRLGYMALLKNLRNIVQQAPELVPVACEQLRDEQAIRKSLVFPFRYITAMREVEKLPGTQDVLRSLSAAANVAVQNVPALPGKTLVAIDVSGSMAAPVAGNKDTSCADVAIMFGAALAQKGADTLIFSNAAQYVSVRGRDLFGDIATIKQHVNPAGTNFHAIFQTADRAYDNIVILSDMQAWMRMDGLSRLGGNPRQSLSAYREKFSCNPRIYSFDLAGYGTLQFPEANVYCVAGFSDRVFDLMKELADDRQAMIRRIEAQEF